MKIILQLTSKENQRVYPLDQKEITLATICPMSYIIDADLMIGSNQCHLMIGRYSSLAYGLSLDIGMDHLYKCITTYPPHMIAPTVYSTKDASIINPAADPLVRHQMIIGSDVWIGANAQLLGAIRIGNGAVIGAGAVVTKDVPPYAIVAGNPARIIKYRFDVETIERLLRIKWWNWAQEDIKQYILQFNNDMAGFLERFDMPEEIVTDENADTICRLHAERYHVSYFIPDFEINVAYAVWPRVIDQFLAAYTAEDKAALVIAMPASAEAYTEAITTRIAEYGSRAPLILSHPCTDRLPYSIAALQASDAYITTREAICSHALDYTMDAGLTIRYGLDQGALLFPPV